jgi:hypothetical protein
MHLSNDVHARFHFPSDVLRLYELIYKNGWKISLDRKQCIYKLFYGDMKKGIFVV